MDCLVISFSKEKKKHFWQRRNVIRKWLSYDNYQGGCNVIILPYTLEEINKMSDKCIKKIIVKLENEMYNTTIFVQDNARVKNILLDMGITEVSGADVFLDVSDILIRKYAKNTGLSKKNIEVGIYDYDFTNKSIDLICNLANSYGHITLFTKNINVANSYILDFLEDSGMPVVITDDFEYGLEKMDFIIALGKIEDGVVAKNAVVLDPYCENQERSFKKISKIFFSLPNSFDDLITLTQRKKDQIMVEFILSTGAALTLTDDIKIIGYN